MVPALAQTGAMASREYVGTTYRYLRLTIVGLFTALIVSVIWQIGQDGFLRSSISAYYYAAPRSIFVGALVGVGAALIAIKGRAGPEETLLNIAGMLAPIVAMVPTPLSSARAGGCAGASRCVPEAFVAGVDNNMWALIITGVGALIVAGLVTWRAGRLARLRCGFAAALWLLVSVAFIGWRDAFLSSAHNLAAAGLFVLIAVVVVINARHAQQFREPPVFRARTYCWIYRAIGAVMAVAAAVALVMTILSLAGSMLPHAWLFVMESVMIGTFIAFWAVQTVQFWEIGVPGSD
ncbi:MAG: hypothetical protein ABI382_09730 [Nakamurella sp.]